MEHMSKETFFLYKVNSFQHTHCPPTSSSTKHSECLDLQRIPRHFNAFLNLRKFIFSTAKWYLVARAAILVDCEWSTKRAGKIHARDSEVSPRFACPRSLVRVRLPSTRFGDGPSCFASFRILRYTIILKARIRCKNLSNSRLS